MARSRGPSPCELSRQACFALPARMTCRTGQSSLRRGPIGLDCLPRMTAKAVALRMMSGGVSCEGLGDKPQTARASRRLATKRAIVLITALRRGRTISASIGCRLAAFDEGAIEDDAARGASSASKVARVEPAERKRCRFGRHGAAGDQEAAIFEEVAGIVGTARGQIALQALADRGRQVRTRREFGIRALVAGQNGKRDLRRRAPGLPASSRP